MASQRPTDLIRPLVRQLQAYVPGEQPRVRGLIKLNTNENPYPPSPRVLRAVRAAVDGRLRLYPSPTADGLRAKLAQLHGCGVDNLIVGNGCDELLALAVRCFVEPLAGCPARPGGRRRPPARATVQVFAPSYSLYPVLAASHGARAHCLPLGPGFALPEPDRLRDWPEWLPDAALTFVTTPHAPSGRGYRAADLEALCARFRGVVLLDETYADFAGEHALPLALQQPHVLVARSFSKAYSLCFQRVGYCVGHPALIAAMHKLRDSYNVNGLGQIAAEATLEDLPYYHANWQRIRAARDWLGGQLAALGFSVFPSQTNFLLVRPPAWSAETWQQRLRDRRILVRWFDTPELKEYLRISVGTPAEMETLVRAVRTILRAGRRAPPRGAAARSLARRQ